MSFSDDVAQMDRDVQLAFGEPVTYAPTTGTPVPIVGVFDEEFVLVSGSAAAGVEAIGPAVFVRLSDLPRDPELEDEGLTLTIRSVAYRVIKRAPDGQGGIVLALRKKT